MRLRSGAFLGVLGLACILGDCGEASAQQGDKKELRKDRVKLALDAGGVALGAAMFNPIIVLWSTGSMGVHTYQLARHKQQARDGATETTTAVAQPTESLAAVPGRPGYFYYPSNPNQLYHDAASASASEPMQARTPEPKRINVLIANTAKDGRTIHYTVAGTPYSVPPGYIQVLATPEGSVIAFDRGDAAGLERFTLADGNYEFRTADQGWRFYNTSQAAAVARAPDPGKAIQTSKPAVAAR